MKHRLAESTLTGIALLLLASGLAGCGLKGELYLPETEPASAQTEDDEDKDNSKPSANTDAAQETATQ